MKIIGLTGSQFVVAIILGLTVSFCITAISVPHPVETPVIVITPVPTPAPVQIQNTPSSIWAGVTLHDTFFGNHDTFFGNGTMGLLLLLVVTFPLVVFLYSMILGSDRRDW